MLKPHVQLHCRPCEISRHISRDRGKDQADLRSCVLEFAKCAETLTVAASLKNANRVLLDSSVMAALQQSIYRLTILSYNDRKSFPVMRKVAEHLVRDGAVQELCIGHCTVSSDMLKDLLEFGATVSSGSADLITNDSSEAAVSLMLGHCDNSDDSNVADSHGNSLDLYDIAVQPCNTEFLPTASRSIECCSCSSRSGSSEGNGIRALTLINLKSTSGSIDTVLLEMLPRLCRLKKLALIGLTEMNMRRTLQLSRASQHLCTLIQSGQLSHVIIDGCLLPPDFLSMLLTALLRRCR